MTRNEPLPPHLAPAADALLAVHRGGVRPAALPDGARPADWTEAYAIQDAVVGRLGPVAGWKVGATTPEAEPFRAAILAQTLFTGPVRLPAARFLVIGVEAELAYRFARPLAPREEPYTEAEVAAAIAAIHPAIEIVDTRFAAWGSVDRLSQTADQFNHGALILGPELEDWTRIRPVQQPVTLTIDGHMPVRDVGGNSAGDPMRMLVWMANVGARSLGGLAAGTVVTTGSTTGTIFVGAGTRAVAEFPGIGSVEVEID